MSGPAPQGAGPFFVWAGSDARGGGAASAGPFTRPPGRPENRLPMNTPARVSPASRRRRLAPLPIILALSLLPIAANAEDGYELWLRYHPIADPSLRSSYRQGLTGILVEGSSPTLSAAASELTRGLGGLLGAPVGRLAQVTRDGVVVAGTPKSSPHVASLDLRADLEKLGAEGYVLRSARLSGRRALVIAANTDVGVLYGAFHLLRLVQTQQPIDALALASAPRLGRRVLNHWDNLDRTVERGYAGFSLWDWHKLPDYLDPRYTDYARANASLGINGTVITSVNANATSLTPEWLRKAAALADVFRPWGLRVYLTARFSAPIEIGGPQDRRSPRSRGGRVVDAQGGRDLRAHPRLRRLPGEGQLRGPAGAAGLQAQPRRGGEPARGRAAPPRRDRDVARVRLLERRARRPPQAGLRRVQAARRLVPRQRHGAGQERRHRLPASRALPSALRRDAEDAADAGAPDHQGIPRLRHAPRVPGSALRGDARRRHAREGARDRASRA